MFSIIKSGMETAMHELAVISIIFPTRIQMDLKNLYPLSDFAAGLMPDAVKSKSSGLGAYADQNRISDGQGSVISTENVTDMALIGSGFFAIQSSADNSVLYTRNGGFTVDRDGFLTAGDNYFVLGSPVVDNQFSPVDGGLGVLTPIQIPVERENDIMSELVISNDGKISARYGNQDELVPISSLALGVFSNPVGLKQKGFARFSATDKSGLLTFGAPMDAGFAELKIGGIEKSNVDITDELTAMIKAQQQFNGSARLMQANSDMVEKFTQ